MMIFCGVLERHPGFKVIIGEAGIGWIPYVLNRMDAEWEDQFKELDLKMPPSDYWRGPCFGTHPTGPRGIQPIRASPMMIFCGVLERHPGFKVIIGEAGIGWIPYVLNRMDAEWEDQFKELDLKMPPSDYWRRQCYATYQTDPVGIKLVEEIGEGNIMWASDLSHPDGIWPDSQDYIRL